MTEFLDVVMHEREIELRLEELLVVPESPLAGITLGDADLPERTGALVLALRDADKGFITNPTAGTMIEPGQILIAIGTPPQLRALADVAHPRAERSDRSAQSDSAPREPAIQTPLPERTELR